MTTYKLRMYGSVGYTQWEFDFTSGSKQMAADYALRLCKHDPAARTCDKIVLFDMSEEGGQAVVAEFAIKQTVTVSVEMTTH